MTRSAPNILSRAKKIKLLLLDVDGVMTDGSIMLDNNGTETKSFHVRDGRGIKLLQKLDVAVGIITGRSSEVVNIRARELNITEVHQGAQDKLLVYETLLAKYGLRDEQIAYIGDDDIDVPILKRVGLAVTVSDADPSAKRRVHFITKAAGGRGAVRECINLILKSRGALKAS